MVGATGSVLAAGGSRCPRSSPWTRWPS